MNLEQFINEIKEQELNLYRSCVEAIAKAYNEADKDMLKNEPWTFWNYVDKNICADYDAREAFRREYLGENNYSHIDRDIDEHIKKLEKSITKVVGNVTDIETVNDTDYLVKGVKADITIKLTPAKLSANKNITKARVKVLDVKKHEEELIEKEPSYMEESEYVKQWKQQELEGYKKALQRYLNNLAELEKEVEQAKEAVKEAVKEYIDRTGKQPEVQSGAYVDRDLHDLSQKRRAAETKYFNTRNENAFFRDYAYSGNFEEMAKKMIDKHFEQLQAKVEKKIGRIIKIESFGGDDYAFEGERGDCVVEVVWAGGYNIQRLHTRWIVKNWNIEGEY